MRVTSKLKARRKAVLEKSIDRLKAVVAELLERLDHLDRGAELTKSDSKKDLQERIHVASTDLVKVTECLPSIDELLKERRLDDAADLLFACCQVTDKVARLLRQVDEGLWLLEGDRQAGRKGLLPGGADRTLKLDDKNRMSD